jgi:hypothetical protein
MEAEHTLKPVQCSTYTQQWHPFCQAVFQDVLNFMVYTYDKTKAVTMGLTHKILDSLQQAYHQPITIYVYPPNEFHIWLPMSHCLLESGSSELPLLHYTVLHDPLLVQLLLLHLFLSHPFLCLPVKEKHQ